MANEPVVAIQVLTDEVVPGKDIQIQLTIAHSANNFLHHVEWVDLVVNEQQSNRWAYSAFDLPPAATFKKVMTCRDLRRGNPDRRRSQLPPPRKLR